MKLKNNKGFTGVDIAVSVVIVITFLSLITGLFYNMATTSRKIERKSIATNLSIDVIEALKTAEFTLIPSGTLDIENLNAIAGTSINVPNGYNVDINVEDYNNENIIKIISANVTYSNGSKEENVKIETLIKNEGI